MSIWNKLAEKLGRQPTDIEVKAEIDRIFEEALIERAEAGKLQHQRPKRRPKRRRAA